VNHVISRFPNQIDVCTPINMQQNGLKILPCKLFGPPEFFISITNHQSPITNHQSPFSLVITQGKNQLPNILGLYDRK
jgi:hypothetical protein